MVTRTKVYAQQKNHKSDSEKKPVTNWNIEKQFVFFLFLLQG